MTPVTTTAMGTAALTIDSVANTLTVYLDTTGVTAPTGAEVDTGAKGAAGTKRVALTQSTTASDARMPEGRPYLDAATIAEVQAWVTAGALNN